MKVFQIKNKDGNLIAEIGAEVWNEALQKFFQARGYGGTEQGLAELGIKREELTVKDCVIHFPK